jgi:stalled ribosome rescue protein Dom34
MKNIKQMGIWMDHSNALLMELTDDTIATHSVVSESSDQVNEQGLISHGKPLINKEQRFSYYKKISDSIRNFQEVVLFGPTDAKNELLNLLKADHLFKNIKIEVKNADKMTENQMYAFIRDYFK